MRNIKLFIILLISVLAFGFTSCETYFNPEGGTNEVIRGNVFAADEVTPLENVTIRSNYGETKTNHQGYFEILSYYFPMEDEHVLTFERKVKSATYENYTEKPITKNSDYQIITQAGYKSLKIILE